MGKLEDSDLDDIESRMFNAFQNNEADIEATHDIADQLLVILVKLIANDDNRLQVKRILDLYESMSKWYA